MKANKYFFIKMRAYLWTNRKAAANFSYPAGSGGFRWHLCFPATRVDVYDAKIFSGEKP